MMKKITILLLLLFTVKGFSQDDAKFNGWTFKSGVNIVDNRGTGELFGGLSRVDQSAFSDIPLTIGIEKRLSRLFGIEALASINSWNAASGILDGIAITDNEGYYALDVHAKLYLDQLFNFSEEMSWLNLYATSGLGRFTINQGTFTFNYGGGASVWISEKVALDFSTTIKNTFSDTELFETGHFVYNLGVIIKLTGKKKTEEKEEIEEKDSLVDSDADGIPDSKDFCPNAKGTADNNGCPYTDSDGDGVVDRADHCPQIKGYPSNNGCPAPPKVIEVKEEPKEPTMDLVTVAKKIKFESGNYNFTQDTYPYLIDLAKILIQEPASTNFKIIGHTDSSGSYEANRALSVRRASAVRNYLVDSGISKSRITIQGLGESEPLDTNLTAEGRANNRRVEIIMIK